MVGGSIGKSTSKKWVRVQAACWLALIVAAGIVMGVMAYLHVSGIQTPELPLASPHLPYIVGGDGTTTFGANSALTLTTGQPMCRFGYAQAENAPASYDAGGRKTLRAGWYLDFSDHVPTSGVADLEYVQVVRLHQIKTVYPSYTATYTIPYTYLVNNQAPSVAIQNIVATAHVAPGSLWLIGNEIERVDWRCSNGTTCGQDEMLPEVYADVYHEIYTAIKAADPTARVANGSQVEISPLRLKYLDRMWNSYLAKYGQPMPVDVWNIHPYMLIEHQGWNGADIPAGLTETEGLLYDDTQNDDFPAFQQQIVSFRQWMASKGEQNKPLIISEFGVLYPTWFVDGNGHPYSTTRVINFMYQAFDHLLTAKDPALGFAADDNRLVQQWNWFSLDSNPIYFNGALFSYTVGTLTDIGATWASYVTDTNRPLGPALNLKMLSANYATSSSGGNPYSATLVLKVSNSGYLNWTGPLTVTVSNLDNTPMGQVVLNGLPGCGRTALVTLQLTNIATANLPLKAQIDPLHQTPDADFSDNTIYFTVLGNSLFPYNVPVKRTW
jgi:hypothetical protein